MASLVVVEVPPSVLVKMYLLAFSVPAVSVCRNISYLIHCNEGIFVNGCSLYLHALLTSTLDANK
jgi:hypothetical protein